MLEKLVTDTEAREEPGYGFNGSKEEEYPKKKKKKKISQIRTEAVESFSVTRNILVKGS